MTLLEAAQPCCTTSRTLNSEKGRFYSCTFSRDAVHDVRMFLRLLVGLSDERKQQDGRHRHQPLACVRKKPIISSPPHIKTSRCSERTNRSRRHLECTCAHAKSPSLIDAIGVWRNRRRLGRRDDKEKNKKADKGKRAGGASIKLHNQIVFPGVQPFLHLHLPSFSSFPPITVYNEQTRACTCARASVRVHVRVHVHTL